MLQEPTPSQDKQTRLGCLLKCGFRLRWKTASLPEQAWNTVSLDHTRQQCKEPRGGVFSSCGDVGP